MLNFLIGRNILSNQRMTSYAKKSRVKKWGEIITFSLVSLGFDFSVLRGALPTPKSFFYWGFPLTLARFN